MLVAVLASHEVEVVTYVCMQYGIVTKTADWTNQEGLALFGDLMCEVGAPTEAILLLLRCAETEVCARMPGERERALIRPHFDMIIGHITAAIRDAKTRYKPVGYARLEEGWKDRWKELPLKEYWDDPDLLVRSVLP
jgi:hypothetical protein